MKERRTLGSRLFDGFNVGFMVALSAVMLYPLLYEVFLSVSEPARLFGREGILLWPKGFTWDNYRIVLSNPKILSGLKNTGFVLFFGLIINLVMTCLSAYFLSRRRTMLFRPVMMFILATMYFSGGLVPTFLNVRSLGLHNSLWALILPGAISTYNTMLLCSFFRSIPESMIESVEIDGGGHLTILFRMLVPLSVSAMAVMVLYYGVGHWNSWFPASIYLKDEAKFPLQLVLQRMLIVGTSLDVNSDMYYDQLSEAIKAATVIVVTVPILFIYPFLQRYFVSGMMLGSLKE